MCQHRLINVNSESPYCRLPIKGGSIYPTLISQTLIIPLLFYLSSFAVELLESPPAKTLHI